MKHILVALGLCAFAQSVAAQERLLSGTEINALLPRIVAIGVDEDTSQTFSPGGATEYIADGKPSTGRWWVTARQYCSSWPPGSGRACYDVLLDESTVPSRLIWVGASGTSIVNEIIDKEVNK